MSLSAVLLATSPGRVPAATDLIGILQPMGWSSAIVARNASDAAAGDSLTYSPQLSPTAPVWTNWAVHANAAWGGYWTDGFFVDDTSVQTMLRYKEGFVPADILTLNQGPIYLTSGRHTLSARCDLESHEDYDRRGDNRVDESYIWAPSPIAPGAYATGNAPAAGGEYTGQPNCEAWQITRTPGSAWAVALRPTGGSSVHLRLYDDYVDSRNGLSHELGRSVLGGDSLEFVMGAANVGAPVLYPAAVRTSGTSGYCYVHLEDSYGHYYAAGEVSWSAEVMSPGVDLRLYELELQGGVAYPMSVWRVVGQSPLQFAVFPSTLPGVFTRSSALIESHPIAGQDYVSAYFTPAVSGRYIIVVWRTENLDGYGETRYKFAVGSTAVGVGVQPHELALAAPAPNPVRAATVLRYSLSTASHVRLSVFDAAGRRVTTLRDADLPPGEYSEPFALRDQTGRTLPSGLYLVRLEAQGRVLTRRLIALR